MPNVSGLMTATVLNAKITEVTNKITDTKSSVITTVLKKWRSWEQNCSSC